MPSKEPALGGFKPALPAIASPRMAASYSGAEKQAAAQMAARQQRSERLQLEAHARKALEQLLAGKHAAQGGTGSTTSARYCAP